MDDSAVCNISLTGLPLLPFRLTGHLPRPGSFRQRRLRKSNTWMEKYQNRRFKWIKPMIRALTNRNNGKFLICQLGLDLLLGCLPNQMAQPWRQCPKRRRRALVRADLKNAPLQVKSRKNNLVFLFKSICCPLNKIRPNQLLWQFSHELQPSRVDYVAHQYHFHTIRGANLRYEIILGTCQQGE